MPEFLKKLESDLRPAIEQILTCRFLKLVAESRLTREQLRQFSWQYNHYCQAFPRLLAIVARKVPDGETRAPLIKNLWEENGEGNLDKSHRRLFLQFMREVDGDGRDGLAKRR